MRLRTSTFRWPCLAQSKSRLGQKAELAAYCQLRPQRPVFDVGICARTRR